MKIWKKTAAAALACLTVLTAAAAGADYSRVADASEMTAVETVGVEGMVPIPPEEVEDGVYDVTVESSSSMFQVVRAVLTVEGGNMTADLTLGGTGYLFLYPGTGQEAAGAEAESYIPFAEDEEGAYTYTVPVPALDQPFPCAAFSRNKEQWYDRTLLVRADSLPREAVLAELPDYEALEKAARDARIQAMKAESAPSGGDLGLSDGVYSVDVVMEGGSGKASVASPAALTVRDGTATVRLEWSSPHYDYMLVDGTRYEPVNETGNSVFEVPVSALEQPLTMIGDTTAMSVPHEIEYTMTFLPAGDAGAGGDADPAAAATAAVSAAVMAALGVWLSRRERRA